MEFILEGIKNAFYLIIHLDKEMVAIVFLSLRISILSTTIATVIAIPLSLAIAFRKFKGRRFLITIINTLMSLPTVVIGLLVYSFLSRRGPLGFAGLLYTPWAMVIGQAILALPLIAGFSLSALRGADPRIRRTVLSLGGGEIKAAIAVAAEGRFALLAAMAAGFGRVFSEVGISMMVGGNIRFYTRNIPTAIALETSKGEFGLGIALGIILLSVAFIINFLLRYLEGKR
jgi:tungstate transport system permease protein